MKKRLRWWGGGNCYNKLFLIIGESCFLKRSLCIEQDDIIMLMDGRFRAFLLCISMT